MHEFDMIPRRSIGMCAVSTCSTSRPSFTRCNLLSSLYKQNSMRW